MSDTDTAPLPDTGHNLPPIAPLGDEMTHHAGLWSRNAAHGEMHEREIMVRAYRLCLYSEDPDTELSIRGLLSKADIPQTKRSHLCTQLLNYAFHNVKDRAGTSRRPEKSQISRWSGALQYALSQKEQRPSPDGLLAFIDKAGGVVECATKARKGDNAAGAKASQPIRFRHAYIALRYLAANDGKPISGRLQKVPNSKFGIVQFIPNRRIDGPAEANPEPMPANVS